VALLGGAATPAVGFSLGLERILLELDEVEAVTRPQVYVASLGEPARLAAFKVVEQLLDGGVGVVGSDKGNIQSQLSRADKLGMAWVVIIGQKEVHDGTVIVRDMKSGNQEVIPLSKIVSELQRRFG
jgi:histidyl-tRNA synthetase